MKKKQEKRLAALWFREGKIRILVTANASPAFPVKHTRLLSTRSSMHVSAQKKTPASSTPRAFVRATFQVDAIHQAVIPSASLPSIPLFVVDPELMSAPVEEAVST